MKGVRYEVRDRVGYLVLDRPEALNAVNEDVLVALADLLPRIGADAEVKALVLGGAGEAFCIGLDIGLLERAFDDADYFADVLRRFGAILSDLETLPVPVVAAVNGTTRAGGFELMLACDLVVAAEDARIGDTHLAFGIVPGGGATQRLPRLVGRQRASEIIFSGRWLDGAEAAAVGLALKAVPLPRLGEAVEEIVAPFRTRSRAALAATKAAMVEGAGLPLREALEVEIERFLRYLEQEPTAKEGFRAWVERREPRWP